MCWFFEISHEACSSKPDKRRYSVENGFIVFGVFNAQFRGRNLESTTVLLVESGAKNR